MHGDAQNDARIHKRLLARDPTASEEIAAKHLESIRRHVRSRAFAHGVSDDDLINDAAVDALFDYIRHPEKFDPTKSTISGYLNRAAERDLINAVRKHRRHRRGEELTDDVELAIVAGNKQGDIERIRRDTEAKVISGMDAAPSIQSILKDVKVPLDRKLVEMMMDGERRTSAFAAVLGINDLSPPEQRRIVKQHKDRIKQQLKRAGGKHSA